MTAKPPQPRDPTVAEPFDDVEAAVAGTVRVIAALRDRSPPTQCEMCGRTMKLIEERETAPERGAPRTWAAPW
jgi:hypothetical protein